MIETLRLPGATAAERASRSLEIQHAYEDASRPPMRVCRCSLRVLELAAEVTARGDPHTAGDAAVAALLAAASLDAAALNVELDLAPIESEPYRAAVREELEAVRAEAARLRRSLAR